MPSSTHIEPYMYRFNAHFGNIEEQVGQKSRDFRDSVRLLHSSQKHISRHILKQKEVSAAEKRLCFIFM